MRWLSLPAISLALPRAFLSCALDRHFQSGLQQGLQACATLITESDWVHARKNTDIGQPRWSAAQFAELVKEFIARKNVPIFNLESYQEGALSPVSVETFKQARRQWGRK
jgi:hypothetical protein